MEYLNFDLRIGISSNGNYPITVIRSPAGESTARVSIPLDNPKFKNLLSGFEKNRGEGSSRKFNPESSGNTPSRDFTIDFFESDINFPAKEIGADLFKILFVEEIRSCYRSSLQMARETKKGLRVQLRIEAPELVPIPWEFLYDTMEEDFLGLSIETPLIRFLELARPPKTLNITPPLNILGMIASPNDLPHLNIEKEKKQMYNAVEHLIAKGIITLNWLEGQSWRDLQSAMRKGPWHIFHFIGHGGFNQKMEEGSIALVNEQGNVHNLSATNLGRLLAGHSSMRLAVLNSCEGAASNKDNVFSSIGASLIRKGIPAVISMQYEITDRAAIEFSRTFYETIAEGIPVDTALQESRKAISFAIEDTIEWGTPVLHMRAPDGNLFSLDINEALFPNQSLSEKPKELEDNHLADTPPIKLDKNLSSKLNILKNKVDQFWIKGVLNQTVQGSSFIQLGLDNMPQMVNSPWGDMPITESQSLGEVFNEVGRSMLILGEPGAGKTTMLLKLAEELLDQFSVNPQLPLPVVFNLSSWDHSKEDLVDWMASELSIKYLIPKKFGQNWIMNRRLFPLLDGLDEVGQEKRNDCVQAINLFLQKNEMTGVVVCSRFKEYLELPTKLRVNGAIRLRLLSRQTIFNYVESGGPSLKGLYNLLKSDSGFLKLAETPFMLRLMIQIYRGNEETQIISDGEQSIKNLESQLLDAYINRQFRKTERGNLL